MQSTITEQDVAALKLETFSKPTTTFSGATMFLALRKALEYQGLDEGLRALTKPHQEIIQQYARVEPHLELLTKDKNVKTMAAPSHIPLNEMLKEAGRTIQLDPIKAPDYGVVALFNVKDKHELEGKRTNITDLTGKMHGQGGVEFSEMRMQKETGSVMQFSSGGKYSLIFTPVDKYYEGIDLYNKSLSILRRPNSQISLSSHTYDGVVLPCIDVSHQPDIEFLLGMGVGNGEIAQALQENQFKMNEVGFEAASATALGIERCFVPSKDLYTLHGPMVVTFATNYLGALQNIPLLSIMLTQDGWKYPNLILS